MKIAYLIMAHTDPVQLNRLIKSLDTDDSVFYIHIDKKVDVKLFRDTVEKNDSNIQFVDNKDRVSVYWGGFSQVKAIFVLIESWLKGNHKDCGRVVLLSGLDYPIVSNTEIRRFFNVHPNREFIKGYNLSIHPDSFRKAVYTMFYDIPNLFILLSLKYLFKIIPYQRKRQVFFNGKYNDVYNGATWWVLTPQCVEYVYAVYIKEKKLSNYFRYSTCPDEKFIPTIILNSKFRHNAEIIESETSPDLTERTPLHLAGYKYDDEIKKYAIYEYKKEDFSEIITSKKMFFRKATTAKALDLMNLIDDWRCGSIT